jgi:hypothetical protein
LHLKVTDLEQIKEGDLEIIIAQQHGDQARIREFPG